MPDRITVHTAHVKSELAEQQLRDALSVLAGPVTIVATQEPHGPSRGFTASSVVSVSLVPPLFGVFISHEADCYEAFLAASGFSVSVLGREQEELAQRFASKRTDKFSGIPTEWTPSGMPAIRGALAVLDCATVASVAAGDHDLLIGCLRDASAQSRAGPLVYFDRSYCSVAPSSSVQTASSPSP